MTSKEYSEYHHHPHAKRKGPSSFWMNDPRVVFREMALEPGDHFLDLGCGPGDYAIRAAHEVGPSGFVWAMDKTAYLVEGVMEAANRQGLNNIAARTADIAVSVPIESGCIDVCLLSTVLHCLDLSRSAVTLVAEIKRVLKPNGRIVVIECKKEDQPFGPPEHMRLSPQDIENTIGPFGFRRLGITDLGYNYMLQLSLA